MKKQIDTIIKKFINGKINTKTARHQLKNIKDKIGLTSFNFSYKQYSREDKNKLWKLVGVDVTAINKKYKKFQVKRISETLLKNCDLICEHWDCGKNVKAIWMVDTIPSTGGNYYCNKHKKFGITLIKQENDIK